MQNLFKAEKYLFLLLLFSIPFQKRVFLWSAGVVDGFNEWQSVFLYGTDILVLLLFALYGFRLLKQSSSEEVDSQSTKHEARNSKQALNSNVQKNKLFRIFNFGHSNLFRISDFGFRILKTPVYLLLAALLLISAISIFNANYTGVAVYRFIKLAEFVGLFFYTIYLMRRTRPVSDSEGSQREITNGVKFEHAALAFVGGAVLQALIAIGQFFRQGALGLGIILGESPISAGRSDVAEFVSFGSRFMRAYGTLPSPNVLAAFLALALLFLITWHILQKNISRRERMLAPLEVAAPRSSGLAPLARARLLTGLAWAGIILISFALLLTFSRAQIAALALAFIFYLAVFTKKGLRAYRKKLFVVLAPLVICVIAMSVIFWPEIYSRIFTTFEPEDSALSERVFYNELSYRVIAENAGGVGVGNYTLFLRDIFPGLRDALYQPVHNVYLLTTAELGIVGGVVFSLFVLYLLLRAFQKLRKKPSPEVLFFTAAFIFILISGFFDHFYWTLQQGALMFWIITAMLYSKTYVSKS